MARRAGGVLGLPAGCDDQRFRRASSCHSRPLDIDRDGVVLVIRKPRGPVVKVRTLQQHERRRENSSWTGTTGKWRSRDRSGRILSEHIAGLGRLAQQ